jgi:hypothetical protein
MRAAFYCVCGSRYFLGAAAMINSLRLLGHTEPIHLLDCGLTPAQRDAVAPHATVVARPGDEPPYLAKTIAPCLHPAETMILIDADIVLTRSLGELMAGEPDGVVGFRNDRDRFVPEWGELLGLGAARRRPYVSSGLVLLAGSLGGEVLRLLHDRQGRVEFDRTFYGSRMQPDYAFRYAEQDVLNAILCTRREGDRIVALDDALLANPPFAGLRVRDEGSLRCAYGDGTEPYGLHHYARKPWLEPMHHGIYSRLLARLLLGPGLTVRVPEGDVPLRMRSGPLARVARTRVNARECLGWRLRNVLPEAVVSRIDDRRHRRAARG